MTCKVTSNWRRIKSTKTPTTGTYLERGIKSLSRIHFSMAHWTAVLWRAGRLLFRGGGGARMACILPAADLLLGALPSRTEIGTFNQC